ncbi:hypothetical protein [Pseudidiomarina sp. CB1]|uniref:hypothetical protein n=1 Tax=Pseudidiomarina sp. CB1 TaxID=2972484 RepID=UPI0021637280|nr:hypothetical protein [Pseudidiomarina sp. CB1]
MPKQQSDKSNIPFKAGQCVGLFKFFRERIHLEQFLDGFLYCNTPEYYRSNSSAGIGDSQESCILNVDSARGDQPMNIEIDGQKAGKASQVFIRMGEKDGWLHCWAAITLPADTQELTRLHSDITRIQSEFGPFYVYIEPNHVSEFLQRMKSVDPRARYSLVTYYKQGYVGHSVFHKSVEFSYQREFRFLFGECPPTEIEQRTFRVPRGFRDIAGDCCEISVKAAIESTGEDVQFRLVSFPTVIR